LKGSEFFTRLARTPPFRKIHPNIAGFLKEYLQGEKAVEFDGKLVINTHFPPFPGSAFDRLMDHFNDREGEKRLFNITVAVTNRCPFNCWHCYNHGRSQADIPVAVLKSLARRLQSLGAVTVQLTGGEPLLRDDLEGRAMGGLWGQGRAMGSGLESLINMVKSSCQVPPPQSPRFTKGIVSLCKSRFC
jgi:hypothetical protein